jgi:hypothetical protein
MLDVILYAAVGLYFIGPVIIWFSLSELVPAEMEPPHPEDADALQALREAAAPLLQIGFRELGAFRHKSVRKPIRVLLLVDPLGTTSTAVAMLPNQSIIFEFQSELVDRSTSLKTNNTTIVLPLLGHRPGKHVRQFPDASSLELYEAHRALAAQQLSRALRPAPQLVDQVIAEQREEEHKDLEYDISRGWAKLRNGRKRPTLRGAFLMSWRIAWPVNPIRRHLRTKEHKRALQAAVASA